MPLEINATVFVAPASWHWRYLSLGRWRIEFLGHVFDSNGAKFQSPSVKATTAGLPGLCQLTCELHDWPWIEDTLPERAWEIDKVCTCNNDSDNRSTKTLAAKCTNNGTIQKLNRLTKVIHFSWWMNLKQNTKRVETCCKPKNKSIHRLVSLSINHNFPKTSGSRASLDTYICPANRQSRPAS